MMKISINFYIDKAYKRCYHYINDNVTKKEEGYEVEISFINSKSRFFSKFCY